MDTLLTELQLLARRPLGLVCLCQKRVRAVDSFARLLLARSSNWYVADIFCVRRRAQSPQSSWQFTSGGRSLNPLPATTQQLSPSLRIPFRFTSHAHQNQTSILCQFTFHGIIHSSFPHKTEYRIFFFLSRQTLCVSHPPSSVVLAGQLTRQPILFLSPPTGGPRSVAAQSTHPLTQLTTLITHPRVWVAPSVDLATAKDRIEKNGCLG